MARKRQSFLGAGPIIVLPGYVSTVPLAQIAAEPMLGGSGAIRAALVAALTGVGLLFVFLGARQVHVARRSRELARTGVYAFTRNPIYCGHIVFFMPAVAVLVGNPCRARVNLLLPIPRLRRSPPTR